MKPQATHYLELLPSELIWQILDQLPSRSLRNLCSALPSLQLESFVHECEGGCPHGLPIKALPACDPVHEWESKHRQYRLRNNLDKGVLCNRDVYALCDISSLHISTDGSLLSSPFEDSSLCINSVRLRPHTFYRGSTKARTLEDGSRANNFQQTQISSDGRWLALTCMLELEENSRDDVFAGFQINELILPGSEACQQDDGSDADWLYLIDSAHEPAVLTKVCKVSVDVNKFCQFQFSTDCAYLIILHRDGGLRDTYGAGFMLSLHGSQVNYFQSLPTEIQELTIPNLLHSRLSAASDHFIIRTDEFTYVIEFDPDAGTSYCTRLNKSSPTSSRAIFCHRDLNLRISVFNFDHAFHIYEHRADRPMSLLRIVQRLDDVPGDVCNIDLRQMPFSIIYTIDDQETCTWVEQSLSVDTTSTSRIIVSSSHLDFYISGRRHSLGQLQSILPASIAFITAALGEDFVAETAYVTLTAWSKNCSGWHSKDFGWFSVRPSVMSPSAEPMCSVAMSACGTAFALIEDSMISVAEIDSLVVSGDSAAIRKTIHYPPCFGLPTVALFATVDESLFIFYEGPDQRTCRRSPAYRIVSPDPLHDNCASTASGDPRSTNDIYRGKLLANYMQRGSAWDLRWCTIVADQTLESISADGSIMLLTDGWDATVLDFSPEG